MPKTIAVRFEGEAERFEDLERFLKDNAGDEEVVEEVRALKPGKTAKFGGGAAPVCTVRMLTKAEANKVARVTFQSGISGGRAFARAEVRGVRASVKAFSFEIEGDDATVGAAIKAFSEGLSK